MNVRLPLSFLMAVSLLVAVAPSSTATPHVRPMADSCTTIDDGMGTVYLWNDLVLKWTKLEVQQDLSNLDSSESRKNKKEATAYVLKGMNKAYKAAKNSETKMLLKSGLRYAKASDGPGVARIYDKVMANLDFGKC